MLCNLHIARKYPLTLTDRKWIVWLNMYTKHQYFNFDVLIESDRIITLILKMQSNPFRCFLTANVGGNWESFINRILSLSLSPLLSSMFCVCLYLYTHVYMCMYIYMCLFVGLILMLWYKETRTTHKGPDKWPWPKKEYCIKTQPPNGMAGAILTTHLKCGFVFVHSYVYMQVCIYTYIYTYHISDHSCP